MQNGHVTAHIVGQQVPSGVIRVSGAKNSATRLLAAALLSPEAVRLSDFPTELIDARHTIEFMRRLGADVIIDQTGSRVEVTARQLTAPSPPLAELPVRTTYLLATGQLAHTGLARIPYPGGCQIGSRGYDLHLMVWERMGCKVVEHPDHIEIRGQLRGGRVDFPMSTVGGTENAILCATVATGDSEIRNAYSTPEVADLIELLRTMGAQIERAGNSMIRIAGRGGLLRGGARTVMPDRIEALTWIVFAALSGGSVTIDNINFHDLQAPILHLRESGIDIFRNSRSAWVSPQCLSPSGVQPFEVACGTHPGVISDMQPLFALLGLFANGRSRIFDYRYPERTAYAKALGQLAPDAVMARSGMITTNGPSRLVGARVCSTDLRGSIALLLAGLLADGESIVERADMALRGYNALPTKLSALGLAVDFR